MIISSRQRCGLGGHSRAAFASPVIQVRQARTSSLASGRVNSGQTIGVIACFCTTKPGSAPSASGSGRRRFPGPPHGQRPDHINRVVHPHPGRLQARGELRPRPAWMRLRVPRADAAPGRRAICAFLRGFTQTRSTGKGPSGWHIVIKPGHNVPAGGPGASPSDPFNATDTTAAHPETIR